MAHRKPKILVTGSAKGGALSWLCIRAILMLGGTEPIRMTPLDLFQEASFDGLLLTGGTHIHPQFYGEKIDPDYSYDVKRDEMELELIKRAIDGNKPIFGICRGAQMLNVFFGGSLYQDLSIVFDDFLPPHMTLGKVLARHAVEIEEDSRLFQIIGKKRCRVNSLHHQGLRGIGEGLRITAWLPNGVVQAVESKSDNWILGVQWHPEFMLHRKKQRKLFYTFVKHCLER